MDSPGSVLAIVPFNIYTYDLPNTIFKKIVNADNILCLATQSKNFNALKYKLENTQKH